MSGRRGRRRELLRDVMLGAHVRAIGETLLHGLSSVRLRLPLRKLMLSRLLLLGWVEIELRSCLGR